MVEQSVEVDSFSARGQKSACAPSPTLGCGAQRCSRWTVLRSEGVDAKIGGIDRFTTVADVIDHFLSASAPSGATVETSLETHPNVLR